MKQTEPSAKKQDDEDFPYSVSKDKWRGDIELDFDDTMFPTLDLRKETNFVDKVVINCGPRTSGKANMVFKRVSKIIDDNSFQISDINIWEKYKFNSYLSAAEIKVVGDIPIARPDEADDI